MTEHAIPEGRVCDKSLKWWADNGRDLELRWMAAELIEKRVQKAALEAQVKTLEDNLRISNCAQCHGSTWVIDSENGGMQVRCHCYQVRVNELRTQVKTLRDAGASVLPFDRSYAYSGRRRAFDQLREAIAATEPQ